MILIHLTSLQWVVGYITPKDKLEGRETEIFAARDKKLELARENRKIKRQLFVVGLNQK